MTHAWLAADPCPTVADPGWLTQPVATVLAATIAVIGALIAYAGVTKTTRTARRETRRTEKVAVLTEAFDAIHELTRANSRVVALEGTTSRAKRVAEADAGSMKELGDNYSMSASKLRLYGFTDAATKADTLGDTLSAMWNSIRADPDNTSVDVDQAYVEYNAALTAVQKALTELK